MEYRLLGKSKLINVLKKVSKISIIFLIFILLSCNKEIEGTSIEYQMDPISNTTVKITYADQSGSDKVIDDWEKFKSGSKKIVVTKKPFTAKIVIESNNQLNTVLRFNLIILVENQIKKLVNGNVPPKVNNHITEATFIVE